MYISLERKRQGGRRSATCVCMAALCGGIRFDNRNVNEGALARVADTECGAVRFSRVAAGYIKVYTTGDTRVAFARTCELLFTTL